ncbi:TPA: SDR family oxidoreductase [Pseudomonas putida]|nr:SDR family oxidoreductase [Pseudomonas putida]
MIANNQSTPRRVLVIGAGQAPGADEALVGNGRAICLSLARQGVQVVCADRDLDAAEATAALIHAQWGTAWAVQGDIAKPEDISPMMEASHRLMGGLDGLVLNAGISDRRHMEDVTPQSWDNIFNVNLRGHMLCVQRALPLMSAGGSIVFISSLAAHKPVARNPAYEASKAGISALCRATAMEGHARDIRANVVVAGLIDTPMGRAASAARADRATGPLPFGRQGTAWEIANAVLFLLSNDASYINAVELAVDGGLGCGIARSGF